MRLHKQGISVEYLQSPQVSLNIDCAISLPQARCPNSALPCLSKFTLRHVKAYFIYSSIQERNHQSQRSRVDDLDENAGLHKHVW